jgi:glycosyltransferase involved in cell wall biosynthesis
MVPMSVVICCANVADTLEAACRSAAWADELIIVDSGSDDDTEAIARRFATRYEQHPWQGYTAQKRYGVSLASHDWVLLLDGDEEVSPQLADELRGLPDSAWEQADLMLTPRQNWLLGRPVRAWFPDLQSRVMQRHRVDWPDEALHDARVARPGRTRTLKGHLEHKRVSAAGFDDYFGGARLDARLPVVARQMHQRGRRCRWHDLLLRPWAAGLKVYLLKGAWKDGAFGIMVAQKIAVTTQLKYAALWDLQHPGSQAQAALDRADRRKAD